MNEFLQIVKECPDNKLNILECPFCGKKTVHRGMSMSTLVAYTGVDRNHRETECHCSSCGESYIYESKGPESEYAWITQNRVVKFGIPRCFESYIYTCSKCNGKVHRKFIDKKSGENVSCTSFTYDEDGTRHRSNRIIFECEDCGQSVESENEYYSEYVSKPKENPNMTEDQEDACMDGFIYAPYIPISRVVVKDGCGNKQSIGYSETVKCGEGSYLCPKCKE